MREPAALFIAAGLLLYGASILRQRATPRAARPLVISADFVSGIAARLRRRLGRAPAARELRGEVAQFVERELLYGEALRLGLDRGDVIVRRRLVQKMRFIVEDLARVTPPSEVALRAHLAAHSDRYRREPRLLFEQRFLARDKHAKNLLPRAHVLLAALRRRATAAANAKQPGPAASRASADQSPVAPPRVPSTPSQIARTFGRDFAMGLSKLAVDKWAMLRSAYGVHIVRVTRRIAGRPAKLAEVRAKVREAVLARREAAAKRAHVEKLRRRVGVRYEAAASRLLAAAVVGPRETATTKRHERVTLRAVSKPSRLPAPLRQEWQQGNGNTPSKGARR